MTSTIEKRAESISKHGTIEKAIAANAIAQYQTITVSEAIVLGLLRQQVTKYFGIFGHGSTDIAEVLRIYEEHRLVTTYNMRHETAAAHAATALTMLTGEVAAVVTSIGPGALHAFAGSLASASNGIGVYHIYGDETTHDEGFNMQQIPKDEQGLFLKLCSAMGNAYAIYEPWSVAAALKRGAVTTGKSFAQPFFLLSPMNVQPAILQNFNLLQLPSPYHHTPCVCSNIDVFKKAVNIVATAHRVAIKIGNGAHSCGNEICELAELLDAAIISGPSSTGIVPYSHPRHISIGGSKGLLCGNYAMNEADVVIVIGARAVCQWDRSGTAWKKARAIINFNTNPYHAFHYNNCIFIVGDAQPNLRLFIEYVKESGIAKGDSSSQWFAALKEKKHSGSHLKSFVLITPHYTMIHGKKMYSPSRLQSR